MGASAWLSARAQKTTLTEARQSEIESTLTHAGQILGTGFPWKGKDHEHRANGNILIAEIGADQRSDTRDDTQHDHHENRFLHR